ncbi:T6SS immunity protein Tdi1 domain-containing protein [Dyella sp.]|uniref:T6SS immunity protein Tdi1 domain-containing protein n=1 Tax=Dyella sp. TaxID=1869338 RepID=UPI002D79AD7F|nr:T6SS immunity protein Tdi1 domain-containing protein [Dyella sp.]HET7333460.1 T6SS immunity protein Tdi1 domain-containing protein [Dyella sp.]
MEIVTTIQDAWGWVGIKPAQIVGDNSFGNLLIKDEVGLYWRLCPEDIYCKVIANTRAELDTLLQNQEFLEDWSMISLVAAAKDQLGALRPGYKYCLKIPGVLGGEYGGSNLATVPLRDLIAFSGHLAKEIQDLPDGTQIRLRVTE